MPKAIICINFYGHQNLGLSGVDADCAPLNKNFLSGVALYLTRGRFSPVGKEKLAGLKPRAGKLWVYDYNAAINETNNKSFVQHLLTWIKSEVSKEEPINNTSEMTFLVTGYSSGGVTAMHMARHLEQNYMNVFYVGLADAAFMRNESNYLMTNHGLKANYKKNYFQTKQNDPDNPEIHDQVLGFRNFNLDDELTPGEDLHQSACTIGNKRMLDDVRWCLANI